MYVGCRASRIPDQGLVPDGIAAHHAMGVESQLGVSGRVAVSSVSNELRWATALEAANFW